MLERHDQGRFTSVVETLRTQAKTSKVLNWPSPSSWGYDRLSRHRGTLLIAIGSLSGQCGHASHAAQPRRLRAGNIPTPEGIPAHHCASSVTMKRNLLTFHLTQLVPVPSRSVNFLRRFCRTFARQALVRLVQLDAHPSHRQRHCCFSSPAIFRSRVHILLQADHVWEY